MIHYLLIEKIMDKDLIALSGFRKFIRPKYSLRR